MKKICCLIIVAMFAGAEWSLAQNALMYYSNINIDSLRQANENLILLPEVKIYANKRKTNRALKSYDKLVRNFKKVYPYAIEVSALYRQIDDSLARMDSKKQRRQYMDMREDQIMAHYKPIMSKFTLSQSVLFVKLLDRECGNTAYDVIKTLKGGFVAGGCQIFAMMFGNDLKKSYDSDVDDKSIEELVQRYRSGRL